MLGYEYRWSADKRIVIGCGFERMLRYLALLMFCVIAVLTQVGTSMAHGVEPVPSFSNAGHSVSLLTTSPVKGEDCAPGANCCTAMCAPCYLPLPSQQNGFAGAPPKSQILTLRQDCLRSIIVGHDPPIPRNPIL